MPDLDLPELARAAASDTLDEWLHKSYVTYPDGLQRRFAKQTDGTWHVYRLDEDGARPQESELIIEVSVTESAQLEESWLELYNAMASRVRALYTEDMRNDICEPMAFQNILEAIADGFNDFDARRTLDTTDQKG
jgi:hypothetical protein